MILLLIGANDANQDYDFPHVMDRFQILYNEIKSTAPNAEVLIATTITNDHAYIQERVLSYNQQLTDFVSEAMKTDPKIHFVDIYTDSDIHNGLSGQPSDLIDGVHPKPEGYERMGEVWFQALKSVFR